MAASMREMLTRLSNLKQRFILPERLKQGIPKKIGDYVGNIYRDYRGATVDLVNDVKERPLKAGFYITCLGLVAVAGSQRPDQESFDRELVEASNDLLLLSNLTRNPDSDHHIQSLLNLRNKGVIRCMNLGVCSIIWEDYFDRRVAIYEAKCDHLRVTWREFPSKIIDVGFMGRWFYIRDAMKDYDINYLEFQNKPTDPLLNA